MVRAGMGILIGPVTHICREADFSIARLAGASMDTDIRGSGAAWVIAITMCLGITAMDSVEEPGGIMAVGTADTPVEAGIGKLIRRAGSLQAIAHTGPMGRVRGLDNRYPVPSFTVGLM